jgi:hypothetical protein
LPLSLRVLWLCSLILSALMLCSDPVCAGEATAAARGAAAAAPLVEPSDDSTSPSVRLITSDQYFNTIAYIFGNGIKVSATFPPMVRTDGLLEAGAATAGVTANQVEQYQYVASLIAGKVVDPSNRDFLIGCKPTNPKAADPSCARRFLAVVGRLLYRRPLSSEELNWEVSQADRAANQLHDFYKGLRLPLEGMLYSPDFLYVTDLGQPAPKHPGQFRLDPYSLASRLSFFLWDAAPDRALLEAAQNGELYDPKGRERTVDRMMRSPRLITGVRAFFSDMLGFDVFNTLGKDPVIYPDFTGQTAQDAREQALRTIVDLLIKKDEDYRDLFTTDETFISPSLAVLYNVPVKSAGWTLYESPASSSRVGFLAEIGFLAAYSHPGMSSPTLRGKAVRELLLCQHVPNPPPNVDFSAITNPDPSLKTMRQRLTAHRKNPVCAGCHRLTDPIGLTLENFDGAGKWRTTENGAPIDASGTLDDKNFDGPAGLGQVLHDDPAVPACLVKRMFSYAVGRPDSAQDQPILSYLKAQFATSGYRIPQLMRTIALSNAFSSVREGKLGRPSGAGGVLTAQSEQSNLKEPRR